MSLEITALELKRRLDSGEQIHLVDVREPQEHAYAHIAGSRLIPMGQVPAAVAEIEALAETAPVVCICHHGVRSLRVAHWLKEQGIPALSLAGGIDVWSSDIDPSVPRY